jgi:CheY-like chemotaxis protein
MPDERKVVLVADDEPDAIEFVRGVLENDFEVVSAPNGVHALEAVKARRPDLIILDVQMPKKDGFATLYDLRRDEATKSIPVILLTAVTQRTGIPFSAEAIEEYMGERPEAYIEKPIDPDRLLRTVRRLTTGRGEPGASG